ncbi:Aldose 1-epimerase [Planctomycetes bacterium CA13]|uniref:Aldose 1-epimerase n=1 Tax=Novipirellula herctigrandis TaxID=2527986 RepID=A0A5C5ZAR5_9BACT|nr:Aldose 1-epimerase [Planctomycetes bacterium CA13]
MKLTLIFATFFSMLTIPAFAHETNDITIENEALRVRINSTGAELTSLVAKNTGREYLWHGDPKFWSDRAPLMFPVNVRFKGDRYSYQDNHYVIPKMGLAIYRLFETVPSPNANEATFRLIANKDTLRQYPFPFELRVTYRLEDTQLISEFKVANHGNEVMPFALGGHPGFAFPISAKYQREDFEYWFSKKISTDRNEIVESLIQPKVIPFMKDESTLSFGDNRVPDGGILLTNTVARTIGLAQKGESPFVTVDLGDFPNVNLWSPPGFPFACIEPMIGHHDSQDSPETIEDKDYLIRLEPGESRTYRFTITVHPLIK